MMMIILCAENGEKLTIHHSRCSGFRHDSWEAHLQRSPDSGVVG